MNTKYICNFKYYVCYMHMKVYIFLHKNVFPYQYTEVLSFSTTAK